MKNLALLQSEFQKAVQNGTSPDGVIQSIQDSSLRSREQRLSVYLDAYRLRMTESLKDDFAALNQHLGEEKLEALALEYVRSHPSFDRNLAEYSQRFPAFLGHHHPELFEFAQREWMKIVSLQSAPVLNALTLAEVQSGAPFVLAVNPSLFSMDAPADGEVMVSFKNKSEVQFLNLSPDQWAFLNFFSAPRSMSEVENWIGSSGLDESLFTSLLTLWIQQGVLYCKRLTT
ncbi:MAG: DNA-binding domain-containing protein [Bdellovibrionales bacterium]|nr:DNA-binding domain-containing protein [Bdellovibrionales bacterium]